MKLTIEIDLENAAFRPIMDHEAKRILAEFMRRHTVGRLMGDISLRDINGNRVGFARVVRNQRIEEE